MSSPQSLLTPLIRMVIFDKNMKILLSSIILIVFTGNLSHSNEAIEKSIGKIILYEDSTERYASIGGNPYSSEHHFILIEQEFNKIQNNYSLKTQLDYLWTVMVRSKFGSHYSERFTALINNCCREQFISEIDKYFQSGLGNDKLVKHKAKLIRNSLEKYKKLENKKSHKQ